MMAGTILAAIMLLQVTRGTPSVGGTATALVKTQQIDLSAVAPLISSLKDSAVLLATGYVDDTNADSMKQVMLTPTQIRVKGTFGLVSQNGVIFQILQPNQTATATLEIETMYNVASGQLQVAQQKAKLIGK